MEIFYLWVAYALLGVFAGSLAGLLGVGGGLIIVPILAVLFAVQGPTTADQELWIGETFCDRERQLCPVDCLLVSLTWRLQLHQHAFQRQHGRILCNRELILATVNNVFSSSLYILAGQVKAFLDFRRNAVFYFYRP